MHTQHLVRSSSGGAKSKNRVASSGALEVCATCKQVLVANDLIEHVKSAHSLANNFVTQGQQQQQTGAGATTAWNK